ncbi:MAG TPA: YciI family protein [Reyranella sp.]|jgi:hypothetical protein
MLFAVHCVDAPGVDAIRTQYLTPHKDYLVGQKLILVVGGALTNASDEPVGSLYIVNVADREAAEAFSKNDPFTSAGVFGTVTITAMRKSHWNPGSA